jgi:hypothetical protein
MRYYGITVRVVTVLLYNCLPGQFRARDLDALWVSHRCLPPTHHRPRFTVCILESRETSFMVCASEVQVVVIAVVPSSYPRLSE